MQKMLFVLFARPTKFVNDFRFWTCFKTYYPPALVKYSGYLLLSSQK